jgi:hypothetical protein
MSRSSIARRGSLGAFLFAFAGAAIILPSQAGCGGAKHAKISGPPPEYEPPEAFDASPATPGPAKADAGIP